MEKFYQTESDPKQLSPLTLAYVGDGVYELFVREYIVSKGNCPVKKLHSRAVSFVRCEFQAKVLSEVLMPLFTEEEKEVCLRGRNAHVSHVPKTQALRITTQPQHLNAFSAIFTLKASWSACAFFFDKILEFAETEETAHA